MALLSNESLNVAKGHRFTRQKTSEEMEILVRLSTWGIAARKHIDASRLRISQTFKVQDKGHCFNIKLNYLIDEKMHNSCQRTLLLFKTRCTEDIENKGCHRTTSVNTMRAAQPSHHSVFVIVQSLPCFRMTFQQNPCLRILAGLVRMPLTVGSILG